MTSKGNKMNQHHMIVVIVVAILLAIWIRLDPQATLALFQSVDFVSRVNAL